MGSRILRFEGRLWRGSSRDVMTTPGARRSSAPHVLRDCGTAVASLVFSMNSRFLAFVSLLIASFLLAPSLRAQDTAKEVDDAIQRATEVAKKMGVKMPDVKKQLEEVNKEEAKERAALQKQLEAPGPLALPDWTPKVPQFEPTGQFRGTLPKPVEE